MTVRYNAHTILDNISLCVHSREFIGIIGPNGAGKTTLLRVLLGLARPQAGKVARHGRSIGYIPQRGSLVANQVPMSVMEVVLLGAAGDGVVAKKALKAVDLLAMAAQRFHELSGGQQQRVLIAKALASHSSILILDEPTTGIDEASQENFFQILEHLKLQGITIIMVSHDVDAVLHQVNRVICLNRTILYDGSPDKFESDKWMPEVYGAKHRHLHHGHGERHV